MAGGGTGGHVVPSLAVAGELRRRGHQAVFIGTRTGLEAKLVPAAGYRIEWIDIGGLQRVGWRKAANSLLRLPGSVAASLRILRSQSAAAIFSMGGYVAGPVLLAAILLRLPIIAMEPNAMPGLVTRKMARFIQRALVSFPEAQSHFPRGRTEVTGLPVRPAFFDIEWRPPGDPFRILITGGSRGARALNRVVRESLPLFAASESRVEITLQTGPTEYEDLNAAFLGAGLPGRVTAFIEDMPAAYALADLVISRSGAGAVSELAAAGRPSVLVPFPYAADDHQTANAAAMQRAGAAVLIPEAEFTAQKLFETANELRARPETLKRMSSAACSLAKPGAAARAADLLEEYGARRR